MKSHDSWSKKVFKLENVEFHCHSIEASCGRRGKEFRAPECLKKQRRPINFSPAAKSAHTKRLSYAALEFLFFLLRRNKTDLLMKINEFASENKLQIIASGSSYQHKLVQKPLCCAVSFNLPLIASTLFSIAHCFISRSAINIAGRILPDGKFCLCRKSNFKLQIEGWIVRLHHWNFDEEP